VRNHAHETLACDFFVAVTATFRLVYVFLALEIGTRRILHWNVTERPTAEWTAQQFRSVLTGDEPYRFVVHDRDAVFSAGADDALRSMQLRVLETPAHVPQANAFCDVSTVSFRSMSGICGRSWPSGSLITVGAARTRASVRVFRNRQGSGTDLPKSTGRSRTRSHRPARRLPTTREHTCSRSRNRGRHGSSPTSQPTLDFFCGLRACEIKALQWKHISFDERRLSVRRSKTPAGWRDPSLNDTCLEALRELRGRARALGFADPEHFLFPWHGRNKKLDPTRPMASWRSAWRSLRRAAGLSHVRFHDGRHTALTRLAEKGVPDWVIRAQFGHV
jgi:hypothetical protein